MNDQLTIFDVVGDSKKVSPTTEVQEAKRQAIQRFLNKSELESVASVSTYSPNGRKAKYFRLVFRDGKKVRTIHIRGGNVNSELALYRAGELQRLIDRGAELTEILAALQNFNSKGK